MSLDKTLQDIRNEVNRHVELWGIQHHRDINGITSDYGFPPAQELRTIWEDERSDEQMSWTSILGEEFLEAIEEAEAGNEDALIEELLQVSAVSISWIQDIKSRRILEGIRAENSRFQNQL